MPEYIGPVEIPVIAASGTFPATVHFGTARRYEPEVVVHQFATQDCKVEQRFYRGDGLRRLSLNCAAMNSTEKAALVAFLEARKGSYQPFTLAWKENDGTSTNLTVRLEAPAAALQRAQDNQWSASIDVIEEPGTAPTYDVTETLSRFPSEALETALLEQVQEVIPLVTITVGEHTIRLSDRRVTIGGNLYQPRILSWDGISQSLGEASDIASFTLGNADRVFHSLVNVVDLDRVRIEFAAYGVATESLVTLWVGHINDWDAGTPGEFTIHARDGVSALRLAYPRRTITRQDGFEVGAQPVSVGGKKGIARFTATSVSNDTAYGKALKDVWVNNLTTPLPVPCDVIAGRDESEFYAALGVVGRGPISAYGTGHTLDNQPNHGPGSYGLRRSYGGNPATGSEALTNSSPDQGSNWFQLDDTGTSWPQSDSGPTGVAFLQIRRTDEKGVQALRPGERQMVAYVAQGLGAWVWSGASAPYTRTWTAAVTNRVWVAISTYLNALGLATASQSAQEAVFDVASAIAAAAICDTTVDKLIGEGTETQFTLTGIVGSEERSLTDWIRDILAGCLGYYTIAAGKLKIGIRINSSVVEAFTAGNIIYNSLKLASRTPEYNHLTVGFADADYAYQGNTLTLKDDDHIAASGQTLKANINLLGVTSKSQAARACTVAFREAMGGVSAAEKLAARRGSFRTTILALNVEPGMVCSLTHPEMPGGSGEFRVQSWRLNSDWSIDVEWVSTCDSMYDTATGPKPDDVAPDELPSRPIWDIEGAGTTGGNLLRNPGFERGLVGWHGLDIPATGYEIVSTGQDTGRRALKISYAGACELHQPLDFEDDGYDTYPCSEGEQFTFTGRYKFDAASTASVAQARIAFYDASGAYLSAGTTDLDPATTDWDGFSLSATAPASAKYMGIFPWFGTLTAGAVYLDTLFAGRATDPEAPGHVTDLNLTEGTQTRLRGRLMNTYELTGTAPVAATYRGFNAVEVYKTQGSSLVLLARVPVDAGAGAGFALEFQDDAPDAALLSQSYVVAAANSFALADIATAPVAALNASGESTTASAPSNVLQTINGNAQNEYSIKEDWAKPSPQNGVVGYHFRSVIYSDALGETEVETIDHPGIQGYDVQTAWSQYRELPTPGTRWIKSGVRSFNAFGQTSVWVWSDLAPLEVDPATIVPQPGVGDWAIIDPTEANGGYGANQKQQKARLRINVIAIPSGADYVTAWVYIDGQYRDMMSTATLGNNDIWIDQPTVETTYDCKLVGNRYSAVRMWGTDNDVKTFTVEAWQLPAALSTFTVTAEADDGATGKILYRLKYVVTGVTDVNRMGVAVFARWTDASWNPVAGTDGDWKEVSWIKSTANSLTWYSSNDYLFAAPGPGVTEYRQFAAIAKNYADDYDTDFAIGDAIVVNSTRTSDGGFDAGTIDPTTIGPGLTVDGDGLASLSRGLMNGDFEDQFDGWTKGSQTTIDSTDQYGGTYCAKLTANSTWDPYLSQELSCFPGQEFRATAYARSTVNTAPKMLLAFYNAAHTLTSVVEKTVSGGDSWTKYEATGVVPANARTIGIYFELGPTHTSGRLLVDNVSLNQVEALGGGLSRSNDGVSNTERGPKNSDFEFGLKDWNYSSQWATDTAEAYKGTAAKCTANGADQYLCQDLPVAPGQPVRFAAYSKESGNSTSAIQLIWYTAAGAVISTVSTTITGDTYALYAVVGTAPATAATVRVNISVPAANTSGRVMVDQAVFTYLEPVAGPVTRDASGVNLTLDGDALVVSGGAITTVAAGILAKLGISDQFKKEDGVLKVNAIAVNYLAAGTAVFTGTAVFQGGVSGPSVTISSSGVTIANGTNQFSVSATAATMTSGIYTASLTADTFSAPIIEASQTMRAGLGIYTGSDLSGNRLTPSGGLTVVVGDIKLNTTGSFIAYAGSSVSIDSSIRSTWRTQLGLGNSATKDVGTGSTNVAAGDHNHTGVYAAASHNHDSSYAAASHGHTYDDISSSGKFKGPGYTTEAIDLSTITTAGWVPCYDSGGSYIGKIPVFT